MAVCQTNRYRCLALLVSSYKNLFKLFLSARSTLAPNAPATTNFGMLCVLVRTSPERMLNSR